MRVMFMERVIKGRHLLQSCALSKCGVEINQTPKQFSWESFLYLALLVPPRRRRLLTKASASRLSDISGKTGPAIQCHGKYQYELEEDFSSFCDSGPQPDALYSVYLLWEETYLLVNPSCQTTLSGENSLHL